MCDLARTNNHWSGSQGSILAYARISVVSKESGNVRDLLHAGQILPLSAGDSVGQLDQNYNHLGIWPNHSEALSIQLALHICTASVTYIWLLWQ